MSTSKPDTGGCRKPAASPTRSSQPERCPDTSAQPPPVHFFATKPCDGEHAGDQRPGHRLRPRASVLRGHGASQEAAIRPRRDKLRQSPAPVRPASPSRPPASTPACAIRCRQFRRPAASVAVRFLPTDQSGLPSHGGVADPAREAYPNCRLHGAPLRPANRLN